MREVAIFLTYNYPSREEFFQILDQLDAIGIECVEIGIPSANAYMDGEVIQTINKKVLQGNIEIDLLHADLKSIYQKYKFHKVLMGYKDGFKVFQIDAILDFCDGIICVDDPTYPKSIPLVNETFSQDELKNAVVNKSLFIYVMSGVGKTGSFEKVPRGYVETIPKIRKLTDTKCYVGFGIQTKNDMIRVFNDGADGVVIGSYFLSMVTDREKLKRYLNEIKEAKESVLP